MKPAIKIKLIQYKACKRYSNCIVFKLSRQSKFDKSQEHHQNESEAETSINPKIILSRCS